MRDFAKGVALIGLFLIPFIPYVVVDSMFFPFITGKNFAFRIIVEVVLAAWIILALLDKDYRPKFSWIAVSGLALVVIMFFANLMGEYAPRSFWSNFERMEGYVTLIHFYVYFMALGTILKKPSEWNAFINVSIFVAFLVAFYGIGQSTGQFAARDTARIESKLGNAAYMAVYMLFHAFLTALMALRTKNRLLHVIYGFLFILFVYLLLGTQTRGTFLGLAFGSFVAVMYAALFVRSQPTIRRYAVWGIVVMILLGGLFVQFKDSSVVQSNGMLARVSNISLNDLSTRATIWGMAVEGVKERPILGWGQGNFNYVFNKEYKPSLFQQESWFDRVHNIFFDWLIAGGVLGLTAYLGLFVGALYYLVWLPFRRDDERFTLFERALLVGLLAGYFTHNLVVFDNIVSYLFFGLTLAFIHSRVATDTPEFMKFEINRDIVSKVVAPTVLCVLVAVVYYVNVPNIQASRDIIQALRVNTIDGRLAEYNEALSRGAFARQEIVEQFAQQAIALAGNTDIDDSLKQEFITRAEEELLSFAEEKPSDARVHVFISGFYQSLGRLNDAKTHIDIARTLSPNKQQIIIQQGILESQLGNNEAMRDYFKEAYDLDPRFDDIRNFYATSLMFTNELDALNELLDTDEKFESFAMNNQALTTARNMQLMSLLKEMLAVRVAKKSTDYRNYTSLSYLYYEEGDTEAAIQVLREGIDNVSGKDTPNYEAIATCFINNIEEGKDPAEGCSG